MINNKEFVWDEKTVLEFVGYWNDNRFPYKISQHDLDEFKKSKQLPNKDYEIVSYLNPNIVTDIEGGNIESANSYASLRNYPIHSVKRKDNKIFTVGDNTQYGKIYRFEIMHEIMFAAFENKAVMWDLDKLEKLKERIPLFTDEQKAEIQEIMREYFNWYINNKT